MDGGNQSMFSNQFLQLCFSMEYVSDHGGRSDLSTLGLTSSLKRRLQSNQRKRKRSKNTRFFQITSMPYTVNGILVHQKMDRLTHCSTFLLFHHEHSGKSMSTILHS